MTTSTTTTVREYVAELCRARGVTLYAATARAGLGENLAYYRGKSMYESTIRAYISTLDGIRPLSVEECNGLLEVLGVRL